MCVWVCVGVCVCACVFCVPVGRARHVIQSSAAVCRPPVISPACQMSAVPLFAPDAPGSVVVRADPAVLLCAPGALYALTVGAGALPVPQVRECACRSFDRHVRRQFALNTHPLTADDVAVYRALAPEGAEKALRCQYPAAGGASVLSLGWFPGLEPYVGSCPDWAAVDPVGEAPRVAFGSLTARIAMVGRTVVLQVAPWETQTASEAQTSYVPVKLCALDTNDNAFLARVRLADTYDKVLATAGFAQMSARRRASAATSMR